MENVKVIDSIMGSGKTTWAIQHMSEASEDKRFIYITPFLDEVTRIKKEVKGRTFKEPDDKNDEGRKMSSLKQLIADGHDVASTHALFSSADEELIDLIQGSGYTLILDEVMKVIESVGVTKDDIETLIDSGRIEVMDDHRVVWKHQGYTEGKFNNVKVLANAGNLYMFRNMLLLWAFPPKVFRAFSEIYVMTYLFRGQQQRAYFDMHGIDYDLYSIKTDGDGRRSLVDYDRKSEKREELIKLIDIYEGPLNNVGAGMYEFSVNKLNNYSKETRDRIKANAYSFFNRHAKARAEHIMWTTLKTMRAEYSGRGYKKASTFVEWNKRATNEYAERWALAYLFNRFCRPDETVFFQDNGIEFDEDLLAVSDLLQWIWRSRIRKGEPIKLYIPSYRMRSLLLAWSKYEI